MPNSNIATTWTPILSGVWLGVNPKNGHKESLCLKETGLHVQNMLTILGSTCNMIEGTYMTT